MTKKFDNNLIACMAAAILSSISGCGGEAVNCTAQRYSDVCQHLQSEDSARVIVMLTKNNPANLVGVAGISIESELKSLPVLTMSIDREGLKNLQISTGIESVVLDQFYETQE